MLIYYCVGSFIAGAIIALVFSKVFSIRRVHEIRRFCPYIQVARDTYNSIAKHFDENQQNFKLISLKIKRVDDKCHMIICKYKSLNKNMVFTI